MTTRTHLAALAATVTAFALGAPAAQAGGDVRYDYAVTIEGTADYNRADADTETAAQQDLRVAFRTTVPKLSFYDDVAEDSHGALGSASVQRSSYTITGASGATVRCTDHQVTDATAGGWDATREPTRTVFKTRVVDAFSVAVGGCNVQLAWTYAFTSGGAPVGEGPFDATFHLPHSAIGETRIVQLLKGAATDGRCPYRHHLTVLCSLTWDATVTFERIGEATEEGDDDLLVPIVPGPSAPSAKPAPPAPPAPPVVDEDLLVPLVAKASLASSLARASVPFTCADACRGTVVATARGASRPLARAAFAAAAGRPARATVRFDAADRRAIRRARGVRLTLKASARAGGGKAVRRSVLLRTR